MAILAKLKTLLDDNRVPYETLKHDIAYTAQELAHAEHVSGKFHAKVVMVKADGNDVMTVLPANYRVDLERLQAALGKPARLATEAEFKTLFPDCEVGTMPPFGNFYGLPVYVDELLTKDEFIVFQAGTHADAVKMSYKDYERLARPSVASFSISPSLPRP
jgi:Ala-tRNA(Pro) deacylase